MMGKFYKLYWVVGLIILNIGCQPEYIEPKAITKETGEAAIRKKPVKNCPEYYYFYEESKINLGTVNTTKIVLGFQEGVTSEQKTAFTSKFPYLQDIQSEFSTGSADATIVLLTGNLSCAQIEAALTQLAWQPEVRFATPFFQSPFNDNLVGITNQFIVNLKAGYTLKDLKKLTKRTKTQIVDQLGEQTFILSADKYSTGNALQMANEFAQFYQVESSEPDFVYDF